VSAAGSRVYLTLVHHPTVDKQGREITSAVTALDMHDLARLARTYGLGGVFIQTNLPQQVSLVERLISHWTAGFGSRYNPNRMEAFGGLALVESVEAAVEQVAERWGAAPLVLATSAREDGPPRLTYGDAARLLSEGERPALVLFGTAWGIAESLMEKCDYVIEPIGSPSGYNHLSVRSAASITVDRLFGKG